MILIGMLLIELLSSSLLLRSLNRAGFLVQYPKFINSMEVSTTDPALLFVVGGIVVVVLGALGYGVYASFGPCNSEGKPSVSTEGMCMLPSNCS